MSAVLQSVDDQPMDSAVLISRWKDYLRANGRSPNTLRLYTGAVAQFLCHTGKPLLEVTQEDLFAFLAELDRRAGTARHNYTKGLRNLYGFAHASGYIRQNPAVLLKPSSPPAPPPTAYTEAELIRLLIAATTHGSDLRRAWTILLGFALGTRRSELAAIRPEDVNLEERTVRLYGKGRKERIVELGPSALAALEGLRPWGETVVGAKASTVTWWVAQCADECGLPRRKRRSHVAMRATSISFLLHKGVPLPAVRDRAGHENLATTDRYSMSFEEDRRKAAALL